MSEWEREREAVRGHTALGVEAEGDVCIILPSSRDGGATVKDAMKRNGTAKPLGDCQVAKADKRP